MVLSTLAIFSYATTIFDFTVSDISYMMFLIYFRLPDKHPEINWAKLNVTADTVEVSAESTDPTLRTFIISILYLSLNALLFISIFRTISKFLKLINQLLIGINLF